MINVVREEKNGSNYFFCCKSRNILWLNRGKQIMLYNLGNICRKFYTPLTLISSNIIFVHMDTLKEIQLFKNANQYLE